MSDVLLEAHGIVRMAAGPWEPGDSVKAAVNRAARSLGLTFRRARSLWYCEASCALRAAEMDGLRLCHRAVLREQMRRLEVERDIIAHRLAALEMSHENLVDRVNERATSRLAGSEVDGARELGSGQSGSVPARGGKAAGRVTK